MLALKIPLVVAIRLAVLGLAVLKYMMSPKAHAQVAAPAHGEEPTQEGREASGNAIEDATFSLFLKKRV